MEYNILIYIFGVGPSLTVSGNKNIIFIFEFYKHGNEINSSEDKLLSLNNEIISIR